MAPILMGRISTYQFMKFLVFSEPKCSSQIAVAEWPKSSKTVIFTVSVVNSYTPRTSSPRLGNNLRGKIVKNADFHEKTWNFMKNMVIFVIFRQFYNYLSLKHGKLDHFDTQLSHIWALLTPNWAIFGPFCSYLGHFDTRNTAIWPFWHQNTAIWPYLAPIDTKYGHFLKDWHQIRAFA